MPDGVVTEKLTSWSNGVQKAAGTLEEGVGSAGGFLVPSQFSASIWDKVLEESIVRPRATFVSMTSNRLEWPAAVDKNHAANFYGGVQVYRSGEGGTLTASSPTFEKINLQLHKITGLVHVNNELLEDSAIAVGQWLNQAFPKAIAFVSDDDFLNGSGANQPLGALNAANPALITVTAISGQGASTVIAENIRDMWSRQVNKSKAIWLANHDVFPQLFGMSLTVGTAGIPVWMPGGGINEPPYQTLFGRPLIYTEKCQALGTAGDIACCDFESYLVAGKGTGEAVVATSIHLKFDADQQSFRFTMRYDGQPAWTSPLTPKYSSTTLSPFVCLSGTRT